MKKVFFLLMLTLFATVMVACGKDDEKDLDYSFSLNVDNVSELRESISIDVTLTDTKNELENSEVRGKITEAGKKDAISDKKVTFTEKELTKEVNFTKLTANTEYVVVFYASYSGTTVELAKLNVKTSSQGTEEVPYEIDSYDDFANIVKKDRSAYFKLVKDIDFNGKSISPMFTSSTAFTGNFDGNGKVIKNFKVSDVDSEGNPTPIKTSTQNYGLFGYISATGKVYNVTLDTFTINVHYTSTSKTGNFGLLAGYCAGTIENVTVVNSTLSVKGTAKTQGYLVVGGLVGNLAAKGKVSNVNVAADINVNGPIDAVVGGVVATTVNSELITEEGAKVANVSKANYSGDIKVEISGTNSYDANIVAGGVVGRNYTSVIDEVSSEGTISVTATYTTVADYSILVGGLVGWNISHSGVVSNSTSSLVFDITTYDVPTEENKNVTVYGGLLVGRNGGGSPSYAEVKNCTYTSTEENKINVIGNEAVIVKTGVVAHEVSTGNVIGCTANTNSQILVQNYQFDAETKAPVADGEANRITFN